MSKFWVRFWWGFTFIGLLGLVVLWFIPEPVSEGDATPTQRQEVATRVREAAESFPNIKVREIKAHGNRVLEFHANWVGENAPLISERKAWGDLADEVAMKIATQYLPEDWQVNVAIWYKRLPRGIAGRTAGENPQGGPTSLYRNLPTRRTP